MSVSRRAAITRLAASASVAAATLALPGWPRVARAAGTDATGRASVGSSPASQPASPAAHASPLRPLSPLSPLSPQRRALIDDFRKRSEGLERAFRPFIQLPSTTGADDFAMPYRLYRSDRPGRHPLVVFLHGSGGLGGDNEKQLALGNIFGTRCWLLPEAQRKHPCHVLVPQTDRGWSRYDLANAGSGRALPIAGLGDGSRMALSVIDRVVKELDVDERRIYLTGQSMGGAGAWNLIAWRPERFAGAVICCGSESPDDGSAGAAVPVWNFHGTADTTVPVSFSRDRIAARRRAGGHPIATEYEGVDHNCWQWAYTEPSMPDWLFAQRR